MTIMEALGGHNGQSIMEALGGHNGETIANVVLDKDIVINEEPPIYTVSFNIDKVRENSGSGVSLVTPTPISSEVNSYIELPLKVYDSEDNNTVYDVIWFFTDVYSGEVAEEVEDDPYNYLKNDQAPNTFPVLRDVILYAYALEPQVT